MNSSKVIYIPYTYLIGWSNHDIWYYGAKFGRDANPETFWVTYHTSSKYVTEHRNRLGEPDVKQIRRTFTTAEEAIDWESEVLRRLDVRNKDNFLNCHANTAIRSMPGKLNPMNKPGVREKHLASVNTCDYKQRMSKIKKGFKHSPESKKLMSDKALEMGFGKWNLGKPKKESTKKKMADSAKKRPRKECPKCGQGYTSANYQKHYNSCKGVKQALYKKRGDGKVRRCVESQDSNES